MPDQGDISAGELGSLPAEYSCPGELSETEERVSSSSAGKAALP